MRKVRAVITTAQYFELSQHCKLDRLGPQAMLPQMGCPPVRIQEVPEAATVEIIETEAAQRQMLVLPTQESPRPQSVMLRIYRGAMGNLAQTNREMRTQSIIRGPFGPDYVRPGRTDEAVVSVIGAFTVGAIVMAGWTALEWCAFGAVAPTTLPLGVPHGAQWWQVGQGAWQLIAPAAATTPLLPPLSSPSALPRR